jgi:tRNA(Ile)-lysidine synthase
MAARTHPPSLTTIARRAVVDERLFGRGELVLCACSGGPDSTALLHVLCLLRERIGHVLVAVGVDHGLRPEAAGELDMAAAVADRYGVSFERAVVGVEPGGNLQARARAARYRTLALAAHRLEASVVATGHTADDRAETVILRLLRGAGPSGLAVLPPSGDFPADDGPDPEAGLVALRSVRPIVRARRSDVLRHLARHGVAFAQDPSNRDERFLRARVRAELMPRLEELAPNVVGHLCGLADALIGEHRDAGLALLSGAQRRAIDRAIRLGKPRVAVRLAAGRDLEIALNHKGTSTHGADD